MLSTARRGTLDEYLAADDIVTIPAVTEQEWDAIRRQAGWRLTRRFFTLRNLLVHGVRVTRDAMGFAWGGIYRTLFVSAIVTTSYRNEGHFRAGDRITGTSESRRQPGGGAHPRTRREWHRQAGRSRRRATRGSRP